MRRRDILAKLAADAAERARQELARRVEGVVDRIRGREFSPPSEPSKATSGPGNQPKSPANKPSPEPTRYQAAEPSKPTTTDLPKSQAETKSSPATSSGDSKAIGELEGAPKQGKTPHRGAKPKPVPTSSKAPDAPKAPKAPKAEPVPAPGADQLGAWGDKTIQDALEQLRRLQDATAQLAQQLEERGAGDAARALLGLVGHTEVTKTPPPEPRAVAPIAGGGPPPARQAPPTPPAPPALPEIEEPLQRGDDSLALQGSRFHIPLGPRLQAFKILWDEWIRAGIGKERGIAGIGETDDAGRPRGPVLSDDELRYLPRAEVVVPGRDGSLLIPPEIMVDFDKFEQMLDQWGVGERITIVVEGMVRAEGAVAKNTWYAGIEE